LVAGDEARTIELNVDNSTTLLSEMLEIFLGVKICQARKIKQTVEMFVSDLAEGPDFP